MDIVSLATVCRRRRSSRTPPTSRIVPLSARAQRTMRPALLPPAQRSRDADRPTRPGLLPLAQRTTRPALIPPAKRSHDADRPTLVGPSRRRVCGRRQRRTDGQRRQWRRWRDWRDRWWCHRRGGTRRTRLG
eukprot:1317866-Prymnesium_polylepis.1